MIALWFLSLIDSKRISLALSVILILLDKELTILIDFVFLYLFREFCHFPVLVSNTLSFCISVIYNYIASVKWVFDVNKEKDAKKQFIVFIVFSVMGLLLNDLIMWLSVDFLSIYYLLAKIIATFIVMIFNFVTRKMFLE